MSEHKVVDARVVYWGAEGAGKTANLRAVYGKLRPDHRNELREVPTRFDPSVSYEVLPIELGEIAGVRTRIQIVAVPGAPEHGPTRKQLLDRVDGIVLIVDGQSDRIDDNLAMFEELRQALAAYGRTTEDVPMVVQYNKRDLTDSYTLEELHRKLQLGDAPVFEATATEGSGVLQTLTTISKRVIRSLREREERAPAARREPAPVAAAAAPTSAATDSGTRMEEAILREAGHPGAEQIASTARTTETLLDEPSWEQMSGEIERPAGVRLSPDMTIVSVGEATRITDRAVRVPLVLGDADGQTTTLALTIQLEPLFDEPR